MYSLASFMVDLQMTKGRLLRVFDMLDEMSTARTPNSKIASARESGLARSETSLDVRGSTTALFHGSDGDWNPQRGTGKP
jgi:hypothetical protein